MGEPVGGTGEPERVFLFVATLGFSRRGFVAAFRHERQSAWLDGLERAFQHFGGMPEELLLDNAKALVTHHDPRTREVVFNDRFHAFCRYWGVRPRACAPYRARTKGKNERGVGYVKANAIAGRDFASWDALEAHLAHWTREVADRRVHGTIGEAPIARFHRDEAAALRPLAARPPLSGRNGGQLSLGLGYLHGRELAPGMRPGLFTGGVATALALVLFYCSAAVSNLSGWLS